MINSIKSELIRLGVDNPSVLTVEGNDHTAFYKGLNKVEMQAIRSEFRKDLLTRQRVCQMTGWCYQPSLVASHIKPFRHCKDRAEAVSPMNGLLLNKHIDLLFDKGFISFDEGRRLMISHKIYDALGTNWGEQLQSGFGDFILAAWANGDDKCKIPAVVVPQKMTWNTPFNAGLNIFSSINQIRKMDLPKWQVDAAFNKFRAAQQRYKDALQDYHLRQSFMDYHRRHVFLGPEVQHASNDKALDQLKVLKATGRVKF